MLTLQDIKTETFAEDGYIIVRQLLDQAEMEILRTALTGDPAIRQHMFAPEDAMGTRTDIVAWNHPGDSSYGLLSRSEPVVNVIESVLGSEVYHYHSKITAKAARTGGAWEWHQDYDYWHDFGCPQPAMASVMFAIDDADRENGCLQVIRGSHKMGLVPHKRVGTQSAADQRAVQQALADGEHVFCELAAGDAMFFHCNTLHRSDANRSERRRWSMLSCYNAAENISTHSAVHPGYTPLDRVPGESLRRAGVRFADGRSEDFLQRPKHGRS